MSLDSRFLRAYLVSSASLFAVGVGFHVGLQALAPGLVLQFGNAELFRPWAGWTSTYMFLHPFGFGVVFVAMYYFIRARSGLSSGWRDGVVYGAGLFLVGSLPVFLLAFASFQVTPEVMICWVIQNACQYVVAGAAMGMTLARRLPLSHNERLS